MPPTTPRSEGHPPARPVFARLESRPDADPARPAASPAREISPLRPSLGRRPPPRPLPSSRSPSPLPSSRRSDDEDPVDHRPDLEEACKPKCAKFIAAYDACVARVEKDTTGEAHCTGQYFDMWGCVDKCVAPNLFKNTK